MGQFLQGLPSALIGIAALFSWVPMVWLAFKLISWQRDASEKETLDHLAEQQRIPAWEKTPDYWSQMYQSQLSDDPIAEGDFYVVTHECISCGAPASVAPSLMAHHRNSDEKAIAGCCYFRKQPSTPAEIEEAVAAVNASCVCAVRYRGSDPLVLSRISPESVDHPFRFLRRR